jgi:hypothetical protein
MNDSVLSRRVWDGEVGVAEFNCVRDDLAFGVRIDKLEAAVGVHGWTNVEAIFSMKVPGSAGCWLGMDEDPTSHRTKWCLVEIKRPLKELHALIRGLIVD